jgi:hypothetical protein
VFGFLAGQHIVVQSIHTGSWVHPSSCQWKNGALRQRESDLGEQLVACLHAVMTLRKSGAIPSLTHVYSLRARRQIWFLDFIVQVATTFVNLHTINLYNTLGCYMFQLLLFLQLRPSNQPTIMDVVFCHEKFGRPCSRFCIMALWFDFVKVFNFIKHFCNHLVLLPLKSEAQRGLSLHSNWICFTMTVLHWSPTGAVRKQVLTRQIGK